MKRDIQDILPHSSGYFDQETRPELKKFRIHPFQRPHIFDPDKKSRNF